MRRLSPLLLLLACLVFVPAARAAGPQVGMADDRILLGGGPAADRAVADWEALGVQQVRIYALWSRIAPGKRSKARPKGFNGADPNSPGYDWAALDGAVNRVAAAGMKPFLTVTGPGPLWTSRHPGEKRPGYYPSATAYASFARAVALRYGDRVDRYILWNEPNLAAWLSPQAKCAHHRCTVVAAHVYRSLVRAAYPAVHKADKGAQVLIGATSSRGSDLRTASSTERPLVFLRALGCVSSSFKPLRTGRCKGFKAPPTNAYPSPPPGIVNAPDKPFLNKDDANLASLKRVEST